MVHIFIAKEVTELTNRKAVFNFIKRHIIPNKISYKLHICTNYTETMDFPVLGDNDVTLWDSESARKNTCFVSATNGIAILERPTLLVQKISRRNPLNENNALNGDFKLMYIKDEHDITNDDWKMLFENKKYVLSVDEVLTLAAKSCGIVYNAPKKHDTSFVLDARNQVIFDL